MALALVATTLAVTTLVVLDLHRPPERQLSARALDAAIGGYQLAVSPVLARLGVRCRFEPTCSHYGREAVRQYGALVGAGKTARRLLRCGPWTPAGTVDPP